VRAHHRSQQSFCQARVPGTFGLAEAECSESESDSAD
jgi:hypothetical protein